MNEVNENIEQTPAETPIVVDPATLEPEIPPGLREVSPAQLAEIRAKIAKFKQSDKKTISGSEAVEGQPAEQQRDAEGREVGEVMTGDKVDWSEYDLQHSVRHLYSRAVFRETPQGPKWVAMVKEFHSSERAAGSHGKRVNIPGTTDKEFTEPVNLGEYMSESVNGPDGWEVAAVMPSGSGRAIVLLTRQVPVMLPDPQPLKHVEEVEAPRDEELQRTEDAAIQFATEEGLTPPPIEEVSEPTEAEITEAEKRIQEAIDFSERVERGNAIAAGLIERGEALPARDSALVTHAVDLNRDITVPAPAGEQPPAVVDEDGFPMAAGIENIRQGMPNLLDGPDFGEVK